MRSAITSVRSDGRFLKLHHQALLRLVNDTSAELIIMGSPNALHTSPQSSFRSLKTTFSISSSQSGLYSSTHCVISMHFKKTLPFGPFKPGLKELSESDAEGFLSSRRSDMSSQGAPHVSNLILSCPSSAMSFSWISSTLLFQ